MKKLFHILFLILLASQAFAQASASATVESRATVIDPIQIDKTVDLDFGNIITAYNPGSVILSPDGTRVAYRSGDLQFNARKCCTCRSSGNSRE
jgi:hypothetical protein